MTKTSTQNTPGAERAASPRRSAPEPILKQCLGNGRADTGQGGKDGAQAGVEVQFTARHAFRWPWMAPESSKVVRARKRPRNPCVGRCPAITSPWMAPPGRPRASALAKTLPTGRFPRQIESGGRRSVEIKRPTPVPPKIGRAPPAVSLLTLPYKLRRHNIED